MTLVGLVCAFALLPRLLSRDSFPSFLSPPPHYSRDVHAAVRAALATVDSSGQGRIRILSESSVVDRRILDALTSLAHPRIAMLPRDRIAIDEAVRQGEVLALQAGRRYLELIGFDLEWLPQSPGTAVFPWARVRRRLHCAVVRDDRWSPLPGVEYTGRLGVQLPPSLDGEIVLIVGDEMPLDIEAHDLDGMPVPLQREVLRAGPASGMPADFWLGDGNPWSAPGSVMRLTIDALPVRERLVSLHLGRRAPRVLARLEGYDTNARVGVCAAPLGVDDAFQQTQELVITPDTPEYFGTGWYGTELASPALGRIRWMKAHGAILVPSARRGEVDVVAAGAPVATERGDEVATLALRINDVFAAEPVTLAPGPRKYRWKVPSRAWLAGTNELTFAVSRTARSERDNRQLGFALQRLTLTMK